MTSTPIEDTDLIAGRLDFLPIGFGCVTSVGGVGHYCVFRKLRQFQEQLPEQERARVDRLYDYWLDHDVKTQYNKEVLTDDTLGMFIDTKFPMIATARLSGIMLDYPMLLDNGIDGLRQIISDRLAEEPDNEFLKAGLECLDLFVDCAEHLRQQIINLKPQISNLKSQRRMADALEAIKTRKPETFVEALQLFWLYALLAGVINYGRLDDFLGPYLAADLEAGRITDEEAYEYVKSLWTLIENRRTTVNGRIIVGGRGRKHPKEADVFLHYCMRDGINKSGGVSIKPLEEYTSFVDFYAGYKRLLDYYIDLSAKAQYHSYEVMNRYVSFLFSSLLTNDCISRGKAILDGGVRYLGGTNETYGNINTSDSLWAINDLVFRKKKYTLREMNDALPSSSVYSISLFSLSISL